jgi:HEAT repeat protein
MRFDLVSAFIGFVAGLIVAAIAYRFRAQIARFRGQVQSGAGGTARFLRNTAESRYREEVTRYANQLHLAGDKVELAEVFVEPRFIPVIKPVELDDTADVSSVFHVVPITPELPALFAPYNIPTLSILDLRSGERHLAILGAPGTGKTAALATMALYAQSALDLQSLDTMAEQVLADEDKDLSEEERTERIKIRKEQQERALAQLRVSQDANSDKQARLKMEVRPQVDFRKLLPIIVNVRDIDLSPASYGGKKQLDPLEPLVKAAIMRLGPIVAQTAPRVLYSQLAAGNCLVLVDGFDEIGYTLWPEKLAWLERFRAEYGANFIVVCGPLEGYDSLANIGLTPLYIRPFSDPDFDTLVAKWTAAWPIIAGSRRRPGAAPDEKVVKRVGLGNRGRTPIDVTLKLWAAFADDEKEPGRRGAYDFYIRTRLGADIEQRKPLAALAAALLDDKRGVIQLDELKAVVLPGGDGKLTLATVAEKILNKGILTDVPNGGVTFRHPLICAALAAEDLVDAPRERVAQVADEPSWKDAMPFAAALVAVEMAVLSRLNAPQDLRSSRIFEMAGWLAEAPADVAWRSELFRRFSVALGGPSQFPATRERAAAALVTSRDKGVIFIFRQALKAPDFNVRRLGCIGLGAVGDPEALKDVGSMLADPDGDVQLAAGLALGALNSETAIETMMAGLFDGEESLRRAVAETLAALPEGGHQILRETIRSSDMLVRRASVFGLSRIKAPWALSLLYRTLLEDAQWYVRSAAEEAFKLAETPEGDGVLAHPDADSLPWLIEWAASKGEGVPNGPNARQVLIRALQEGDPLYRAAAAMTIAHLGFAPGLKPLYWALRDQDETVRGIAHEALGMLQARLGVPLPAI